ncbi:MAG TPA: sigma-70 family RNA polymerase sigma factor [Chitinophagaceae bacterium]|nr:sigma-70 family RNA polymerase sigma factor [Chitinophagaceae bacterium]
MKAGEFYSDEQLVAALREEQHLNKPILFLYNQYLHQISSFLINYGASEQEAQDVFQETVVAFIDIIKRDRYKPEAKLATFLTAVAKNIWFNEVKKKERSQFREKEFEKGRAQVEADISQLMGEREMKTALRNLLLQLDERCRKILTLFYYEEMSMKEILQHLPYENEQVVRNKKSKCLQHLTGLVKNHPLMAQRTKYKK